MDFFIRLGKLMAELLEGGAWRDIRAVRAAQFINGSGIV